MAPVHDVFELHWSRDLRFIELGLLYFMGWDESVSSNRGLGTGNVRVLLSGRKD